MKRDTSYEAWMKKQGVPIVETHGVEDVGELPLKPWARTGGRGAFIQLKGMEGFTGMYVSEIPPAGALEPEKHLYEELIYVLRGAGSTEIWSADDGKSKLHFEWQQGSLFAVPLNCWHKLYNGSRGPALLLSVTSAPIMIDLLHDEE
ncbi:MAG TPA: cupin domain-containing protein, partial [Candidatus Binatia bacterium]